MRQLAMRQIDRPPGVEQLHDGGLLVGQKPVDRVAARSTVIEGALGPPGLPAVGPDAVHSQHRTGPGHGPAFLGGMVDQLEQPRFGGRIDSRRDRAAQPQLDFPRRTANSTAWSITPPPDGRPRPATWPTPTPPGSDTLRWPGRDACKAAIAPSRAVLRNLAITVRSTPASAAAWA